MHYITVDNHIHTEYIKEYQPTQYRTFQCEANNTILTRTFYANYQLHFNPFYLDPSNICNSPSINPQLSQLYMDSQMLII